MQISSVEFTKRFDGFHYFRDRKIQAVRVGNGFGALVTFEMSQIDHDFKEALHSNEVGVWVPSAEELEQIKQALDKSDRLTHDLLGRGWNGKRPYWKLEDFM